MVKEEVTAENLFAKFENIEAHLVKLGDKIAGMDGPPMDDEARKKKEMEDKKAAEEKKKNDKEMDAMKTKMAEYESMFTAMKGELVPAKITVLESAYKGIVPEDALKTLKASWEKMDIGQLNTIGSIISPLAEANRKFTEPKYSVTPVEPVATDRVLTAAEYKSNDDIMNGGIA